MKVLTSLSVLLIIAIAGCQQPDGSTELLTVDFTEEPVTYQFESNRKILLFWGTTKTGEPVKREYIQELNMTVSYSLVDIDQYGVSTVKAEIESVITRQYMLNQGRSEAFAMDREPARTLRGKSYTLKVTPTGQIEDASELNELLREAGELSMGTHSGQRVKSPDMVTDIQATQLFIWDSVASAGSSLAQIDPGQAWQSVLSIPVPMIVNFPRKAEYTLADINETQKGKIAIIDSSYSYDPDLKTDWPLPWQGRFQMRGTFGFLSDYRILELDGAGKTLFNVDTGMIETADQTYTVEMDASAMNIGERPTITIQQTIKMTKID